VQYKITKVIEAKTLQEAIKNESKAEIKSIEQIEDENTLSSSAIGFWIPPDSEDAPEDKLK
jgi:hypothetical protein